MEVRQNRKKIIIIKKERRYIDEDSWLIKIQNQIQLKFRKKNYIGLNYI